MNKADSNPAANQADCSIGISRDPTKVFLATEIDPQWVVQIIRTMTDMDFPPNTLLGARCIPNANVPVKTGVNFDVYTASLVTGERVVKKVPRIRMSENEDMKGYTDEILTVAELWVMLRSDYILPFYGVGMEASKPTQCFQLYLVAPLMENSDAVTYLSKQRKCPNAQEVILCIIMDAARGLQYLHNREPPVVYSKMRGDNILISDSGRGMLGGVGFVNRQVGAAQSSTNTEQISLEVTSNETESRRWMAPEMFTEKAQAQRPSDVWGWAMTALELISGLPEYHQNGQPNVIAPDIQMNKEPARADHVDFEDYALKPDEMWALLERCWEFEPGKRPTIDEVLIDLKRMTKE
ncbi:hypothetical protein FRC08_014323 [Ceratobasidium sp. 394]|nr:hypothetical protein FRC08_014323 [Ceratobasidium sp. 394]